jgi:4-hydroxy-tetrahydrodipicolinate synthase
VNLQGTFTALVTPFSQDGKTVDYEALKKIISFQLEGGVVGLVPCGTTGESPTLTHNEHRQVIAKTVEWAKEKRNTIILAGTGSNSTTEAVELTQSAASDGADCALVVNPYYNKPTQEGLYRHFSTVADSSQIPIVLYNIPGRTGINIELSTMKKLAAHDNIIAVKEATGDLGYMAQQLGELPADFALLSGDDNLTLPLIALGGKGVVSVVSNLLPGKVSQMINHALNGELEFARKLFFELLPLCNQMFIQTNPVPVKFAAAHLGLCANILRLPMTPLESELEASVIKAMEQAS